MNPMKSAFICGILFLAMLAVGCAKPPTEDMNSATEAVTRAENDNDAVTYAASSIARAREALERMNLEAASKRYDSAKSYAAEAIAAAERAISDGRAGASRAREEANALVSEIKPMIEDTRQGISAARSAALPLDFDIISQDFDMACRNTDQAQAAIYGSRYQDAIKLGRTARSELVDINQQLSNAAISISRKK